MAAFLRTPSLSDREWLRRISLRLGQNVRAFASFHPLYYSLADEAGIADLGAAWDFDFGHESRADMRIWLRQRYGTLAALNVEWGTAFSNWNAVQPMTTDDALRRSDDNFSAGRFREDGCSLRPCRARRNRCGTRCRPDGSRRAGRRSDTGVGRLRLSTPAGAVDVSELYDMATTPRDRPLVVSQTHPAYDGGRVGSGTGSSDLASAPAGRTRGDTLG